jgi:3-phosphoshikimate 1-carboxyvinyltransferase
MYVASIFIIWGKLMIYIAPGPVNGYIDANRSKSHMQRVILAASMASGETRIKKQGHSSDEKDCIAAIKALGAHVEQLGDVLYIKGGMSDCVATPIQCGESGFCLRTLAAIAALSNQSIQLIGRGSLSSRPMGMIYKPLLRLGVKCEISGDVAPVTVCGPLIGGKAIVSGRISSQFLSGLLLALPKACGDSELFVTELRSRPYIRMTLDVIASFGVQIESNKKLSKFFIRGNQSYHSIDTTIEGDWSGASFMLVAGAVAGEVTISGLNRYSTQADLAILNVLKSSGVRFQWNNQCITVFKSSLMAFEFDATDCPDLFPPLVVLACCAEGTSRIFGVARLLHKESDRGAVLVSVFLALGANIKICGGIMEIIGGSILGGTVDSHSDHRIAMACAVAGLTSRFGVNIVNESCVCKSNPDFFTVLQSLQGRL